MPLSAGAIIGITESIRALIILWGEVKRAEGKSEAEIDAEFELLKQDLETEEWNPYRLKDV